MKAAILAGASGVGHAGKAVRHLNRAIAFLTASLASFEPTDPERLIAERGEAFFETQEDAIDEIVDAIKDGPITNSTLLAQLLGILATKILKADEIVAQTAIADAIAGDGDDEDIVDAQIELAIGQDQVVACAAVGIPGLGFCEKGVESFEEAWENTQEALPDPDQ